MEIICIGITIITIVLSLMFREKRDALCRRQGEVLAKRQMNAAVWRYMRATLEDTRVHPVEAARVREACLRVISFIDSDVD